MTAVLGVAAVVSVALPLSVAGAAGGAIVNGDFETGAPGDTVVTGWSFADQVVDLGVTSLGGCVSKDTSTYTTLRGYDDVEPVLGTVPVGGDGEVFLPGTSTPVWLDENGLLADAGAPGALQLHYGPVEFSEDGDTWTYTDFFVLIEGAPVLVGDVGSSVGDGNFSNGFYDSVHPLYLSVPDPTERADDVPGADFFNYTEFSSQLVAPGAEEDEDIEGIAWGMDGSDLTPTSQALLLSSDMDGSAYGYVAHGPAAVSDPFTTAGARTVSLDWAAAADVRRLPRPRLRPGREHLRAGRGPRRDGLREPLADRLRAAPPRGHLPLRLRGRHLRPVVGRGRRSPPVRRQHPRDADDHRHRHPGRAALRHR
ncbi:hypothetical protein JKP75_17530 [Blastococcus sp. TML/M2B]|uniref:hypothetical protein n=1 Tax=Blastococcus sp. TML/M2B TaxID=2798727 RepID=UPI00190CFE51|nr:hypothetical protein [Blastococcus sp. TML/M2B]MBN1094196.1 hypothetical protein [Blastococcus sp. TML/M2B]